MSEPEIMSETYSVIGSQVQYVESGFIMDGVMPSFSIGRVDPNYLLANLVTDDRLVTSEMLLGRNPNKIIGSDTGSEDSRTIWRHNPNALLNF